MPYDKIHGPSCNEQDVTGHAPREWGLTGTDAPATVATNGYITNGGIPGHGMRVGDTLLYRQTGVTPPVTTRFLVLAVNANGSVDLSDGTQLSTTNTA